MSNQETSRKAKERKEAFRTSSGIEIKPFYTHADTDRLFPEDD
jgi:hypothetical protein